MNRDREKYINNTNLECRRDNSLSRATLLTQDCACTVPTDMHDAVVLLVVVVDDIGAAADAVVAAAVPVKRPRRK